MRRARFSIVALVLLTVVMAPPAGAHRTGWSDRDQAEDADREMEIRSVIQSHPRGLKRTASAVRFVTFTIRTFEDFDNSRLDYWETEHWALMIGLSLDDRPDFDRMIHVDVDQDAVGDDALYGILTAGKQRFDAGDEGRWVPLRRVLGFVRVSRPATDTVRVSLPAAALRYSGLEKFRWMVRVAYRNRVDSESCGCTANSFDYAPPARMGAGHV